MGTQLLQPTHPAAEEVVPTHRAVEKAGPNHPAVEKALVACQWKSALLWYVSEPTWKVVLQFAEVSVP